MDSYFNNLVNEFKLGNGLIERTWVFEDGFLKNKSIVSKNYQTISFDTTDENLFCYQGLSCDYDKLKSYTLKLADVQSENVMNDPLSNPYLKVIFYLQDDLHGIIYRYNAILYDNSPAVRTYIEVKSVNMPLGDFYTSNRINYLERYDLDSTDYNNINYEFFTRTDKTNDLVKIEENEIGYNHANVVIIKNKTNNGMFLLKESPCFSDERPETEGNFLISRNKISVMGWGIRPEEFISDKYFTTYSSVVGVFNGDYDNAKIEMKRYQKSRYRPDKTMIMVNPWGDRQCMEHMSEKFVLNELDSSYELGATHYQLDDGWEKGKGLEHIVWNEDIDETFWKIDEDKFPNGFKNIQNRAEELGIKLGLWFAPDFTKEYRNYYRQLCILYRFYKDYGIKYYKIDGVQLRSKESEENLQKLLNSFYNLTNGDVFFNLDTTNNPRAGYFMFLEYGNVFLENRYTDWGNYYPYLTLRNEWDLADFIPLQKLQIEFLNISRNIDKYDSKDKFAPCNYTPEYVYAITMFANPLCWFEPSSLNDDLMNKYKNIISLHKKYIDEISKGYIMAIGDRPDGYSWTGFQSHSETENRGYMIIFREYSQEDVHTFKLYFVDSLKHNVLKLTSLTGNKKNNKTVLCSKKSIDLYLNDVNSFDLLMYELEDNRQ